MAGRMAAALCLVLASAAATAALESPVVCQGTQRSEYTRSSSVEIVRSMRQRLEGCQYVIGDVHIVNVREQEFIDRGLPFDLSFLDSIVEVTGCINIVGSCFHTPIGFRGLRVIRGSNCSPALAVQYMNNCAMDLPPVDFRNLTLIASGDVRLGGLRSCHMAKSVNYHELFQDPSRQNLTLVVECNTPSDCHVDCTAWRDGRRYCWGPGRDQCQLATRCVKSSDADCPSGRCFRDSASSAERCCSEQCAGGCAGPAPRQCRACAGFSKAGACVSGCSPDMVYDTSSASFKRKLERKHYPLGPVCVDRCPKSYFVQRDSCVSKCMDGFAASPDGVCTELPELGRLCDTTGGAATLCSPDSPILSGGRDNASELCTELSGDLSIITDCFDASKTVVGSLVHLTVADLFFYLSRLRVIRGSLHIMLDRPDIANLTFLPRLRRVDKRPGQNKDGHILVKSRNLRFLGLGSLVHVAGQIDLLSPGGGAVGFCPGLLPTARAFAEGLIRQDLSPNGLSNRTVGFVNRIRRGFFAGECPREFSACHPQCHSAYGCWGPGPGLCVRCRRFKLPEDDEGGVCIDDCSSVGGWYDGGRAKVANASVAAAANQSLCSRCPLRCSRCSGPLDADCLECAPDALWDGDQRRCVAKCSAAVQFAGADRACHPCPAACYPLPAGQTCSGNLSVVGPGGCSFCSKVAPDGAHSSLRCLTLHEPCPPGHQAAVLELTSDSVGGINLDWLRKRPHQTVTICRACAGSMNCAAPGSAANPDGPLAGRELDRATRLTAAYAGVGGAFLLVVLITGVGCYCWRKRSAAKSREYRRRVTEGRWDDDGAALLNGSGGGTPGFVAASVAAAAGDDADATSEAPTVAILRTISEKELARGAEVGSGAFGTVFRGEWLPEGESRRVTVAIKILSDSGDCGNLSSELLAESRIMATIDHRHCLSLVGICMTQPLQLITQFMPLGNLRDFLRARRDTGQLGSSHLLRFAAQIASGMAYLEQRSVIHRDLACRNVLVASNTCVKITDFGLARLLDNPNEEYRASGGKLPVKWLALECLISRRFTHKSDVWAYGVTLWEIFMFGEPPYPNVKPNDLADYLEKGERLPQPPICTLDVYIVLIKCWMLDESQRPAFEEMEAGFRKMCAEPGRYMYIKGDKFAARNPSNESGSGKGGGVGGGVGGCGGSKSASPTAVGSRGFPDNTAEDSDTGDYSKLEAGAHSGNQDEVDDVFDAATATSAVAAAYGNIGACSRGGAEFGGGGGELRYLSFGSSQDSACTVKDPGMGQAETARHHPASRHPQQDDGYLKPIPARSSPNPGNGCRDRQLPRTVNNPEYFFNSSRPPLPPPPPPALSAECDPYGGHAVPLWVLHSSAAVPGAPQSETDGRGEHQQALSCV